MFHPKTCDLYFADAYFGLMKTGPNGGKAEVLANSIGGVPFLFVNSLDIDEETGIVYFTDTSTVFQRRYIIFYLILHFPSLTARVLLI